ncbi:alpha/beta hydrolase [Amycolatopsis saalfeldensis]|uniref:TAP-like protein n=1 Tax=Amycolatopsis saalfeldensis TaxID=394193 RepID=A0A1H8SLG0_9PSEU|nr:alpha/beta hydrolase [Amycolatopsis saalfeldensis]SEO79033.1 TAP-like protein [Amycolatopsis saalfeldensis]
MRRILPAALAAAAVMASVAAVTAAVAANAEPAGPPQAPVAWGACPKGTDPALQCATLPVPLDYRHPEGRKIDLAISRLPSKDPAKRRGALLTDPGGPGLPGQLAVPLLGLPQQVRDSYDVIGFDPRGIGRSAPLTCDLTREQNAIATTPPYPYNAADVAKQAEAAKTIARQCATSETSDVLPFVTTANTARDMDRIRAALGEGKISYYGESYGTYLGAVYTTLFPDRSDRIVLDSSLPPEGYDIGALRSQGAGFQTRFPDFAKFAAADPKQYGLGATPAAVNAGYFQLAERLDKTPAQGYDGTAFRASAAAYIRSDSTFPLLATLWRDLDTGRPLPPELAQPDPGNAPFSDRGRVSVGYLSVICNDSQWPASVRDYQRDVAADRARYPMYGPIAAEIRPCAFWPAPAEPKVRITGRGPSDVLMVQNLRDPATPLAGALRTRAAFGGRARLVTVDQGGHVAYGAGNKCGNDAVTGYLVTGQRPAHDAFCPAQPA